MVICTRSSTDRTLVFGTSDVGSIPAGCTRASKLLCLRAGIERLFPTKQSFGGKVPGYVVADSCRLMSLTKPSIYVVYGDNCVYSVYKGQLWRIRKDVSFNNLA